MKLKYYENPNYIFISWNEDCDGEYRISPFGYVPEKGMTEYFVTSGSVEFIFSKNGIQQDALFLTNLLFSGMFPNKTVFLWMRKTQVLMILLK